MVERVVEGQVGVDGDAPAALAPALDLLDRLLDVARGDGEAGLQAVRIRAAEVVQVAVLGADELHLELGVRVARAAGVDHEVDVRALLVHVLAGARSGA